MGLPKFLPPIDLLEWVPFYCQKRIYHVAQSINLFSVWMNFNFGLPLFLFFISWRHGAVERFQVCLHQMGTFCKKTGGIEPPPYLTTHWLLMMTRILESTWFPPFLSWPGRKRKGQVSYLVVRGGGQIRGCFQYIIQQDSCDQKPLNPSGCREWVKWFLVVFPCEQRSFWEQDPIWIHQGSTVHPFLFELFCFQNRTTMVQWHLWFRGV